MTPYSNKDASDPFQTGSPPATEPASPLNVEDERIQILRRNIPLVIVLAGFVFVTGVLFVQRLMVYIESHRDINKHIDRYIGYEIVGPNGWTRRVSQDGLTVRFEKPRTRSGREVAIELFIDPGNPYGEDAAAYLMGGVLPRLRHAAKIKGKNLPEEIEQPYYIRKGSILWATLKFFYDYSDVKAVYVTMHRGYVFQLRLSARDRADRGDREAFERTLRRFRFLQAGPTRSTATLPSFKSHDAFLFESPKEAGR